MSVYSNTEIKVAIKDIRKAPPVIDGLTKGTK